MSDLVERLKATARHCRDVSYEPLAVQFEEAATRIAYLERREAEARELLEFYGHEWSLLGTYPKAALSEDAGERARAWLSGTAPGGEKEGEEKNG